MFFTYFKCFRLSLISSSEQTLTLSGGSTSNSTEQPLIELEGPMLTDTHTQFKLTTPSPMPQYLNVHYICESASRLLFLSMHWARSIPAFQALRWDLILQCWTWVLVDSVKWVLILARCLITVSCHHTYISYYTCCRFILKMVRCCGGYMKLEVKIIYNCRYFL